MKGRESGAPVPVPSGTVTFLFSDIEGSTQRWDRDRAAMQIAVRLHDQLLRVAIAAHDGYVFKTIGDAFCAAFSTPENAVAAALDAQRAIGEADFTAVDGLRVRMAINTGTADERDGDYFGPTVNRVARLLALGHGGQVLLSGIAASLARENPPPSATLADLGAHELKDLQGHEIVYQLVAPGLKREFPALRAPKAGDALWNVPDAARTKYFTGREHLLDTIRQQLAQHHRAALSGLGGVGKTQTGIEYAVRHRSEYRNGVFWINAETGSGLTSGFVEIAKTLRLAEADSNDQELIVESALQWLNANDHWLLILDNVEDRREIGRFVPERSRGDVLITSRESVFQELGIPRALEVLELGAEETATFLFARTGRDGSDPGEAAAAAQLATELGNLPLALEQAAAYIAETNAAFEDYLDAFRKRRVALLEKSSGLVTHETVSVTWAANFEAVERSSPGAADALRISAFLAPDAIPIEVFSKGADALGGSIAAALSAEDNLAINELLQPLARYSLIRAEAKSRSFGVHRLVQEIVRAEIDEPDRKGFVNRTVGALNATFPDVAFETWATCDRLVSHVAWLGAWVDLYDTISEAANRVFCLAGRYYIERGRYVEAKPLLERALSIGERALGPEHAVVALTVNTLAILSFMQGANEEAQQWHERALAIRERTLGPDHPDVARTLNGLANTYYRRGRFVEAQPLYERALTIWEHKFGPESPEVATGLNNLAVALTNRGRFVEAMAMNERALSIRERTLGPEHPHIALSLSNIAELYRKTGRAMDAEPLLRRAIEMRERAFGPDHRDVRESLNTLAGVLADQKRFAEAKPLYERALASADRSLGPDHADAAEPIAGLADLELKQGRHAEAQRLHERALAIAERGLGHEHPEVAHSLRGLANIHILQGKDADAEPLLERALSILERAHGPDNPEVAETLVVLAALRKTQNRAAESRDLLKRALTIKQNAFGAEHTDVAAIRDQLESLGIRLGDR
ncbi:MAG TPA: FxSxx-COOH system tetratricopeptide repeat protein [Candidatus Eremiobacteraceae bacterium]